MNIKNNKLILMYSVVMLVFVVPLCGAGKARHNGARGIVTSKLAGQSGPARKSAHGSTTRSDAKNGVGGDWSGVKNGANGTCSGTEKGVEGVGSGAENAQAAGVIESGRAKSTISEFDMALDVATGCAKLIAAGVMGWQTFAAISDKRCCLNNFLALTWATGLAGRNAYDGLAYLKRKYVDDRESRTTSLYNDLVQLKKDFFGQTTRDGGHVTTTEKRVISLGRIITSGVTAIHMASEANRKFNESQAVPDRLVALCYAWCWVLAGSDVYDNFKYVFEGF